MLGIGIFVGTLFCLSFLAACLDILEFSANPRDSRVELKLLLDRLMAGTGAIWTNSVFHARRWHIPSTAPTVSKTKVQYMGMQDFFLR